MRNFLLLFLFSISISLTSQVTIGSHLEPIQGALLDLKQFLPNENNATATKGLQLPRVELKSLRGNLSESLGLNETTDNLAHIGLTVYNMEDSICPLFPSGVYTWNGSQWNSLYGKGVKSLYSYTENVDGIGILTDYEGNQYTTKRFIGTVDTTAYNKGTVDTTVYNKVWMTQNLRSLKTAEGVWINCPGGIYFNPALHNGSKIVKVVREIPEGKIDPYYYIDSLRKEQSYKEYVEEYGLYYSTLAKDKACPEGWHLPTKAEWVDLFAVMGSNFINEMRKNPGEIYGPVGYDLSSSYVAKWGETATPNGFNMLPNGYVYTPTSGNQGSGFAQTANYWASDARFGVGRDNTTITYQGTAGDFHVAIRCVKND